MVRASLWGFCVCAGLLIGQGRAVAADRPTAEQAATGSDQPVTGEAGPRQLAVERARRGDAIAALRTLSRVADPAMLADAIRDVEATLRGRSVSAGSDRAAGDSTFVPVATIGPAQHTGAPAGNRGGAMINFGPLINLVQTTIAPDTWEDAGGPSTIVPYAGGIIVDPSGLVTDIDSRKSDDDLLENIAVLLARNATERIAPDSDEVFGEESSAASAVERWRLPASYRCVSLRAMTSEIARRRLAGEPIDQALRHTAGLSRVRFVIADPEQNDVILVGRVGGIESSRGWMRDGRTGAAAIRSDFLAACFAAVITDQPLGCSIDPTPQSLAAAAEVSASIRDGKIAAGIASDALRDALGHQSVRVFGIDGNTALAHLMVEADRHMKRLTLGLEPMPEGCDNYLDLVAKHIRRGPPDGKLLRLWFTASPISVRVSGDGLVHELSGRPMELRSETQLAGIGGKRLASPDDIRLVELVDGFNHRRDDVANLYPAYAALESVYHAASIAEVIGRTDSAPLLGQWLAALLLDDPSAGSLVSPKRVASIAVSHEIKRGGRRHFVVLASGGVLLRPSETLADDFEPYPSLDAVSPRTLASRKGDGRWWWDLR
jgi:hypothetical protein